LRGLIEQHPQQSVALQLDVTDRASISACVQAALASPVANQRIDVLVHNAGYGLVGAIEECDEAQVRRNFETNFFGAMFLTQALLPHFRAQRSGLIIAMSAAAVISNYAGFGVYGAAKWALEGMCESLRAELAPVGVKVMMVEPGPFRTDFIARSMDKGSTRISEYDRTSGQFTSMLERMSGKQPGDPMRGAQAIVTASQHETVPARLVLGRYAIEKTKKKWAASQAELATWEELGLSADFPK